MQGTQVNSQAEQNAPSNLAQTDNRLCDQIDVLSLRDYNLKIDDLKQKIVKYMPKLLTHSAGSNCESEERLLNAELLSYFLTQELEDLTDGALPVDRPKMPENKDTAHKGA